MNSIEKCIATLEDCTRKLQEATARLQERRLDIWLRSESSVLPRWKRKPHTFHTLPNGEVEVHGSRVHTVRTQYLRSQYSPADVDYLTRVVMASRVIVAEEADRILREQEPDRSYGKRRPAEADPDPDMRAEYRARPERRMTAEDLAREQFSGRGLVRELRRIGRKP